MHNCGSSRHKYTGKNVLYDLIICRAAFISHGIENCVEFSVYLSINPQQGKSSEIVSRVHCIMQLFCLLFAAARHSVRPSVFPRTSPENAIYVPRHRVHFGILPKDD